MRVASVPTNIAARTAGGFRPVRSVPSADRSDRRRVSGSVPAAPPAWGWSFPRPRSGGGADQWHGQFTSQALRIKLADLYPVKQTELDCVLGGAVWPVRGTGWLPWRPSTQFSWELSTSGGARSPANPATCTFRGRCHQRHISWTKSGQPQLDSMSVLSVSLYFLDWIQGHAIGIRCYRLSFPIGGLHAGLSIFGEGRVQLFPRYLSILLCSLAMRRRFSVVRNQVSGCQSPESA
jgi:hypothetical protein